MNRLAFGDFAVTLKPIPNVVRGSEVQITQMEVLHGKVQYNAALFNSNGEFQNFIGPFPESAFGFRRDPSPKEAEDLLRLIINGGMVGKKPAKAPKAKAVKNDRYDF